MLPTAATTPSTGESVKLLVQAMPLSIAVNETMFPGQRKHRDYVNNP